MISPLKLVTIFEADLGDKDEALSLAALCVGGMVLSCSVEGSTLAQALRGAAYRRAQSVLKSRPC